MSSSNSPCAACKIQRRKCTQECVFAPYFPPDNPQRFAYVHKVFGASNVAKLLNELNTAQREDAVKSLAYEAEARLRDPVYGCVGLISVLQHKLKHLQTELNHAKKELATYVGPQAMLPILQPPSTLPPAAALFTHQHPQNASPVSVFPFNGIPPPQMIGVPPLGGSQLVIRDPQHQLQVFDAQGQLAAAMATREQQEMMHQQELLGFNDNGGGGYEGASASETGFNQMSTASAMSPSLALGPTDHSYHQIQAQNHHHHHHHRRRDHSLHHQLQAHLMLSPQNLQPSLLPLSEKQPKSESEERRSTGPSC